MRYVATIQGDQAQFVRRIADLFAADLAGNKVLVSATYVGGGLASFAITDADLPVSPQAQWEYAASFTHMGEPELTLLTVRGQPMLTLAGMGNAAGHGLPLISGGGLGPLTSLYSGVPLPADLTQLGQVATAAGTFLYAARRGEVEFTVYREDAQGRLVAVDRSLMPLAPTMPHASLDKMISVQMQGETVIVAISGLGNFLASQRLDGAGRIIRADYMTAQDGSGFNSPNDVAAVTVGGQVYLIVTSALSSSITTIRLLPDGGMIPVDHVVDELTTRFQGATALATVEVGGRAYVFVGGQDDGISMFTVLPDGRLLHLETLVDDNGMVLADISALQAIEVDGKIALFVTSATEAGVGQIVVDPGQIGIIRKNGIGQIEGTGGNDMLRAGSGTTHIRGGAGDDILMTHRDPVMLWGGAGHDIFVATPVAGRILIWDYDPAEDRLDLTQLGMIRSIWQLSFSPFGKGIRIRFGNTLIEIHSADGGTLLADLFTNEMFPITHYAPPDVETVILGSAADDLLSATRGGSEVYGLGGNDVLLGSAVEDALHGGEGNDTISGGAGDDTLLGEAGHDRVRGGDGNDLLEGGDGNDMLIGDGGNDLLQGDGGNDSLFGGEGDDSLNGLAGDDYLSGDQGNDLLDGGAGNDSLSGGDGNDRLTDSLGDNIMAGGAGNDTLIAGAGADRLSGGAGDDSVQAGNGNDTIEGGDGRDHLTGEAGDDSISGDGGNDTILGGLGHDWLHGGDGDDQIWGHQDDDVIHGGAGDDQIWGGSGNDLIRAGDGNDTASGEAGDDTLIGSGGQNLLDGGTGNDLIHGDALADRLIGGGDSDTLFGHGGLDTLEGGDGDDLLLGGEGDDDLAGGAGNDMLLGGEGGDRLQGQDGNDHMDGGEGDDLLQGGLGSDLLHGGEGDDTLQGDAGADMLFGGLGADRFVFRDAEDSTPLQTDRIADFQHGHDLLDLSALGLQFIASAGFSAAGQLRVVNAGDHQMLLADLDGDGQADLAIRVDGAAPILADDLLLWGDCGA
ncbi:calcium-binding protein [Paracoccus sp. M683]|uniref:calcium-binding protein n=1 Tax=Paracoccus sp. M683 TaxID=2594268 RepID=UPI0021071A53|nr:calcium-binding protein [Paracoccus sp. M683]